MNLLIRQILALIRKNLLILCARRFISTFIRALAIPLIVVFIVAYSKTFFASSGNWGVSSPYPIRSLRDGMAASSDHKIVAFVDNGMKGEVASVIDSLSRTIQEAGGTPRSYDTIRDINEDCASNKKGNSPCYGGVIFYSSPSESSSESTQGTWNYTILRDYNSGNIDVKDNKNGPELRVLPLQRAVDLEIVSRFKSGNTSALPETVNEITYTSEGQSALLKDRKNNYLALCSQVFGAIFSFTMIGIVYHMTSFVATERESGMTGLIDTMIPGGSELRSRLARQVSTYISFAIVYCPSWIVVGTVISTVVFPNTSRGLPFGYHILSGLAFTSFSLFGASFFKKAQLSGSIMIIIVLVFAILPQVLWEQKKNMVIAFSLLFPSANYTYFIINLALWESADKNVDMMKAAPLDDWETFVDRIGVYLYWILLVIQILVYPVLAFALEHLLFSTGSRERTFAPPANAQSPTVALSNLSKSYTPGFFGLADRIIRSRNSPIGRFIHRKDVHAVKNLDLKAYAGQILCLLGPNGSGKSTTLNCIAGQHEVTSGSITIDPTGGLGYAPQGNVIWPELTVEEHVRIFSDLKCVSDVNEDIISNLVRSCDLEAKMPAQAKTLSGGQKRKLQLAMMLAGGSTVCCVDEVSTGLDPISRRRIWEILLAERSRRTIIMTTHFLDEADFLADNVIIMYKGSLKAEGTSVALKHRFGDGYTVKLPDHIELDITLSGPIEKEISRHQTVYRVGTASLAAQLVQHLERQGIQDYQLSGPTMEELFLKTTGDTINTDDKVSKSGEDEEPDAQALPKTTSDSSYTLTDGRPLSAIHQWWLLFCKRFLILKRRYIPYIVILVIALVGAGISPVLIENFRTPMACPQEQTQGYYLYRIDMASRSQYGNYIVGPPDMITEDLLERIAEVYSVNNTQDPSYGYYGFHNSSQLREMLTVVDTFENFTQSIRDEQEQSKYDYYGEPYSYVSTSGGAWLADPPTIMANPQSPWSTSDLVMQNFLNSALSGVKIAAAHATFPETYMPDTYDFKALLFIVYYGLIMAAYPAFFALYPTNERISHVRSMQYSNGIRPLPLWLSHLAFDGIVVLIISAVGTGLLQNSTPVWIGLGYIFLIMFLYGIVSALLSYVISMFAKSAVAAWFMCALSQVVLYFAYLGGVIGINSSADYEDLEYMLNALYLGLGIISPVVNIQRAFAIGLGQFSLLCNGHTANSINLFGGPILYLILQGIILSTILLWWDSSFIIPSFRTRTINRDREKVEPDSADLMAERKRITSTSTDLRVESVTKFFGKNLAVDNVTFGVQTSEIFALLGPNGAGKSTIISMIRGDIKPSTSISNIQIAQHSILSAPVAARASLGVCPQFDSADVLTVTETLVFFAKTRGVADINHNVTTVLAACGLEPWAHQLAQNLSGGTKRKLSLAVALVGNPKVLVLDEPSSALDANAKRKMWRTLQSVSRGRAVVLTTHSMEEADALADRIGIVSSRMLAIGDREALKKRAGDAFHIHLVAKTAPRTTPEELQEMKNWVSETFEDANVSRETQGGQLRFEISAEGRDLVGLIRKLEASKDMLGVEFYSVGKATLDEVFENIVKKYSDYNLAEK